jgi:hypothetical protein
MKHPNLMTYKMKETIWHLWKAGDPMANISKLLTKPPATIFSYLQYHGGIRPRLRSRSINSLTIRDRETITRGLASGDSIRAIARQLERSPSTVCREVNNGGLPTNPRSNSVAILVLVAWAEFLLQLAAQTQ